MHDYTPEEYRILKAKYEVALEEKRESFFFLGAEVLTAYAKYLLQHLKPKFEDS